jgi:tRNA U34 5-methylaminomethyl-2-thiouridine-forming methyltransferase MnmC
MKLATVEMAVANMRKVQILQNQATLSLFTMPNEDFLLEQAREYLSFEEEIRKLKKCIAKEKEQEARKVAATKREAAAQVAYV